MIRISVWWRSEVASAGRALCLLPGSVTVAGLALELLAGAAGEPCHRGFAARVFTRAASRKTGVILQVFVVDVTIATDQVRLARAPVAWLHWRHDGIATVLGLVEVLALLEWARVACILFVGSKHAAVVFSIGRL